MNMLTRLWVWLQIKLWLWHDRRLLRTYGIRESTIQRYSELMEA